MMFHKLARSLFASLALCVSLAACGGVEGETEVEQSEDPSYSVGVTCDWKPTANPTACLIRPGLWGITCESTNKSCGDMGKACLSSGFTAR